MKSNQSDVIRRVYDLSGCKRIVAYSALEWDIVDIISEHVNKTPEAVLQMVASQFEGDVFERHGADAALEMMNRLLQWGRGICGEAINTLPDPRIAPRP